MGTVSTLPVAKLQHMFTERDALGTKLQTLAAFLITDEAQEVSQIEMSLLHRQLAAMSDYYDALNERISFYAIQGTTDAN